MTTSSLALAISQHIVHLLHNVPQELVISPTDQHHLVTVAQATYLSKSLTATLSQIPNTEMANAAQFMAQATTTVARLAKCLQGTVGLGSSKDNQHRQIFSIGDQVASYLLSNLVKQFFPNFGLLDEESGGWQLDQRYIFIIDPIDGSIAFTRGIDESWAVGMALYDQTAVASSASGVIAAAVAVPQPSPNDVVVGVPGFGCFNGQGQAVHVSAAEYVANDVGRAVVSIGQRDLRLPNWRTQAVALAQTVQRLYVGIDVQHSGVLVAQGKIDALLRIDQPSYDTAPVIGLVVAAGGVVTSFSGHPINLVMDTITTSAIIASNGDPQLLEYLHRHIVSKET